MNLPTSRIENENPSLWDRYDVAAAIVLVVTLGALYLFHTFIVIYLVGFFGAFSIYGIASIWTTKTVRSTWAIFSALIISLVVGLLWKGGI